MGHPRFSSDEIVQRGEALYQQSIRALVEPLNTGKIIVIDIETGEYEIDEDSLRATHRAQAKHPGAALCGLRIGSDVVEEFGGFGAQRIKQ